MMPLRLSIVLGLCAWMGPASPLRAEDWPRWRGPAGDGHAPATSGVPTNLPPEPAVEWRIRIGDGLASPVVAGGKLVYFDNQEGKETLHAVEESTGRELWRRPIDDTFKDSQYAPGPRCTPTLDGDRVLAQSCRGKLRCLRMTDGTELWSVDYTEAFGAVFTGEKGNAPGATRHGYNGPPIVSHGGVIALAGGTNGAGVVCLDRKTGKVLWKGLNDQAGYAPPVVATMAGREQILCFMVDGLVSADARDGHELWRTRVKTSFARHASTPVVVGDLAILSSHQAGMIATRVARKGPGLEAEPAWTRKEIAMNFASPVVVDGYLYGLGPNRDLFCAQASTGATQWTRDGYFTTSADKAHAAFLVLGRSILCLTDGGTLVLYAADPTGFHEQGRAQVCGANWCNPAYANGRLYLRDRNELMAVRLVR